MGEMTANLSGRDFRAGRTAAPQSGGRFLVTLSLLTLMLPITFTLGTLTMTPSRALFMVLMPIQLIGLLSGRFGKVTYVDWLILAYMFWRTVVPFYHNPNVALQYAGSNSIIFLVVTWRPARWCARSRIFNTSRSCSASSSSSHSPSPYMKP
ncbi:MAG: hypothetical protein R3D61_03410 [Defluviimonas denitrificans]